MNRTSIEQEISGGRGDDLKVPLACPDCGTDGWVLWSRLPHAMHCKHCGGSFWLAADGQLRSRRQAEKRRFTCPRCRHRELVPKELAASGVRCPSCALHVKLESDAKPCLQEDIAHRRHTGPPIEARRRQVHLGSSRFFYLASAALILSAIAITAWFATAATKPVSLEDVVMVFTADCFQGRVDAALLHVSRDQHPDFMRWLKLRYRPVSALRGAGEPTIDVKFLREGHHEADLRVVVLLQDRPVFTQTQSWSRSDAGWRFNPRSSLAIR